MAKHNTAIEWTHIPHHKGETWNPIVGCSLVSPGCTNCYAMRVAHQRLDGNDKTPQYAGTTKLVNGQPVWTGKVSWHAPALKKPLQWTKPRAIFVNSMGDLFHEDIAPTMIARVLALTVLCPQHIFIILTKRPERMKNFMIGEHDSCLSRINTEIKFLHQSIGTEYIAATEWPLPNVWLGVSVEDQRRADERIKPLLMTPAKVRFLSCEPLVGPVDLRNWLPTDRYYNCICEHCGHVGSSEFFAYQSIADTGDGDVICTKCNRAVLGNEVPGIDWVIAGGESGPNARPTHPNWFKQMQWLCQIAKVPFFFKQWGEWQETTEVSDNTSVMRIDGRIISHRRAELENRHRHCKTNRAIIKKVGKARAGRLLNDQEYNEFPDCVTDLL